MMYLLAAIEASCGGIALTKVPFKLGEGFTATVISSALDYNTDNKL